MRGRQGNREIRAEDVEYREADNALKVEGDVEFADPLVHATWRRRQLLPPAKAQFRDAEFELRQRAARGKAQNMQMTPEGLIKLDTASFTTCPRDDVVVAAAAEQHRARHAHAHRHGSRHARVDFKGVPIMYLAVDVVPSGNERKSGFLFPTCWAIPTRGGAAVRPSYYCEHAPKRGSHLRADVQLPRVAASISTATRATSASATNTKLEFSYLPNDGVLNRRPQSLLPAERERAAGRSALLRRRGDGQRL